MKKIVNKQPKTIPTLLGIMILTLATGLGVFLIRQSQSFSIKASVEIAPREVKITNLTDSSFSVSWITQEATQGFVSYKESSGDERVVLDDQEKGLTVKQPRFVHYVTLENLKSSTLYFFRINSRGVNFDRDGNPYEVTTAPAINLPLPTADTAHGMVIDGQGNPAKGTIVYLSLANTTPLSCLVGNDGSWVIPLSTARTNTLSSYSRYDREIQIEEIFVQGGNLGNATAILTTKIDSPAPTITLGENYDFRNTVTPTLTPAPFVPSGTSASDSGSAFNNNQIPTPTVTSTPSQANNGGFSSLPQASPSPIGQKLTILNPDEGEKINTAKPEFIGTAPGGEILEIKVESETAYSGQVLVDEKGDWKWTPPANLPPGEHTITVTLKDKEGVSQKVVRNFTVYAAGESNLPSFEATPSAITVSPAQTTTISAQPTRIVATPTEKPTQPQTGNLTTTFLFFTMGLALLFLGVKFFTWNQ